MVFTLHRYIFREAFKVFVLAALALTLILSLGSILRPVQEYGVGPGQVVHLMGYSLPIMLTFVLPMAALFATALVYGRFASDNELDACRASGISLLTLVYPGLVLAVIVAIANLILSFYVTPAFVHRAKKSLKADAKQILFRNIKRKGYYKLPDGRYLIYADQAEPQTGTLLGVIVVELKGRGIKKIITAENAQINFNSHRKFNEVQITAYNTHQMGLEDDRWFFLERLSLTTEFGSLLRDDIKFKKISEMKKVRDVDLMRFNPIAKLARDAYAQFTAELLAQDIEKRLTTTPQIDGPAALNAEKKSQISNIENSAVSANSAVKRSFYKLYSGREFVEFTAAHCHVKGEKKIELTGEVTVIESDIAGKQPLRTWQCSRASLHIEGDELAPTLTMDLYSPTWQRQDGRQGQALRHIIRGLIVPKTVTDNFKTGKVLDDIAPHSNAAATLNRGYGPSRELEELQNRLHTKIAKTLAEIAAEMHTRLVFGIGCVPMILIGIGLGIILKGGHLLTAFGASCVPAAVLIVCIMAGKNITKNLGAQAGSGVMLMWAALVFLAILTVVIFRKLLKN